MAVATALFLLNHLQVACDHLADHLIEADFVMPAQLGMRLGRVTEQDIDFRRAKIARIDAHHDRAGLAVDADFLDRRSASP
jgi:hypothetical protein